MPSLTGRRRSKLSPTPIYVTWYRICWHGAASTSSGRRPFSIATRRASPVREAASPSFHGGTYPAVLPDIVLRLQSRDILFGRRTQLKRIPPLEAKRNTHELRSSECLRVCFKQKADSKASIHFSRRVACLVAQARNRNDRPWGVPGLVAHKAHRYQSLRC